MARRRISARERAGIFARHKGACHICGQKIDGGREAWDLEHIVPLAMGGDDDGDNLAPAHVVCHRQKTAGDKKHIAKADRMRQRAMGIRRQPKSRLPGSRGGKWKKLVDGGAVRRDGQ